LLNLYKNSQMVKSINIEEIKQLYPNEWVLLGNPDMDGTTIISGVVVFHAPTKQGLLEGRHLLKPFKHSTWTFTGERQRGTRQWVGIFRQIPKVN
jgi:hypothetical protein